MGPLDLLVSNLICELLLLLLLLLLLRLMRTPDVASADVAASPAASGWQGQGSECASRLRQLTKAHLIFKNYNRLHFLLAFPLGLLVSIP
jgi:NADH:ubiquinone oxidoreductase subunit H